jgi:O-acetyl-ADP-ribose deacetylase (regulator of RNase III)
MPLQIIRNDITRVRADAIVNTANPDPVVGGGTDSAIYKAAGEEKLLEARRKIGPIERGRAAWTPAFGLKAKYIIHTVGPAWIDGTRGERELLRSCYEKSLAMAEQLKCRSVAFPLISSGVYGYPKDQALRVAVDTIAAFLAEHEMTVYLVIFGRSDFQLDGALRTELDVWLDAQRKEDFSASESLRGSFCEDVEELSCLPRTPKRKVALRPTAAGGALRSLSAAADPDLQDYLRRMDESFSQMLLRKIDEKGMTDVECYKKANIDRKLFSKIRSDVHYRPKKPTALAFAIALELSLEETRDLLKKAGFALSRSNPFDLIVEYFIQKGVYRIHEINEALFAYDQCLLGG